MAGLAKLRLVMELDGDKAVIVGVDKVDAAVDRAGRTTRTATEQMAGGMGNVETATGRMAATHNQAMNQMAATTRMNHNTMTAFEQQIQAVTMRVWNLTMAAGMIAAPFAAAGAAILFGLNSIDDFAGTVTQIAAQLTQLQGPRNIAQHYKDSVVYATALVEKMEEVDEKSSANSKGLMSMLQVMTTQGVVLDINNKKQVTAFTDLSNAIAMVTKGQNQEIQAYQEMRGLTTGQIDQNSQLSKMIDSQVKQQGIYKGGLKEVVELGKQHGDLLERLQPYLVGINAASGDIAKQWSTATASLETAVNKVTREGFKEVYADIVPLLSQMASYLKDHSAQIGTYIQDGWRVTKSLIGESGEALKVVGVILQTTVVPAFQDTWNLIKLTVQAVTEIPAALKEAPGVVTALGIAAYYAVGGIAGMTLAYDGLVATIAASMASNPVGWVVLGLGALYVAARPAISALDQLIQKYSGYTAEVERAKQADAAWEFQKQKALFMYKEGGIPLSGAMKSALNIVEAPTVVKPPTTTTASAAEINQYNSFVTAFNNQIRAIEEGDITLTAHEKELTKIHDIYEKMLEQYPKEASSIKHLEQYHVQEISARQAQADAIKNTSNEFKAYLDLLDNQVPEHNSAGQFRITNEEMLKLIDTLNGQTAVDDFNEKLRILNSLMLEAPERADAISSAISKLTADFNAPQIASSIAQINNQISLTESAEKTYVLTSKQAAEQRIGLLGKLIDIQQKNYDQIKGNEPAAILARQETQNQIVSLNKSLLDQQLILRDQTAIGGMTNAIQRYGDEVENIGQQMDEAFSTAFYKLEDAITNSIVTMKFQFKDLFNFILSEAVRISIARPITNMLAGSIGSLFSSNNYSGLNSSLNNSSSGGQYSGTVTSGVSLAAFAVPVVGVGATIVSQMMADDAESERRHQEALRMQKVINDSIIASKQAFAGDINSSAMTDLLTKQEQYRNDVLKNILDATEMYDDIVKAIVLQGQYTDTGYSDTIVMGGLHLRAEITAEEATKLRQTWLDLLSVQESERNALLDKQNSTTNSLLLQEMELKGLKGTAEYITLLNKTREAEMVGLDNSDKEIQRRIYALQDEAEATRKTSEAIRKTVDIALSAVNAIRDIQGGSLSNLSPEQKYLAAKEAFANAAPDQAAELGKALLTASQSYYASGAAYQTDYASVMSVLSGLAGMDDQTTPEKQLTVLEQIRDLLAADPNNALSKNLPETASIANILNTNKVGTYTVVDSRQNGSLTELLYHNNLTRLDKWLPLGTTPSFDVGSPFIPSDMMAKVHQGEIIMDRASSDVLRKYGIPMRGSADSKGVEDRLERLEKVLDELVVEAKAAVRVAVAGHSGTIKAVENAGTDKAAMNRLALQKAA